MPRTARAATGNVVCHVINRGNARADVFHTPDDYATFLRLMKRASERIPMRLLGYCLMNNHFHFVLWPRHDGDLSRWMHWLTTTYVHRHGRHHDSTGHVWQGRFKLFSIQQDEHLFRVLRYVERNPVRAGMVSLAERYAWSSASPRAATLELPFLHPWPVIRDAQWRAWVNQPINEDELAAMRRSVNRGTPYGAPWWRRRGGTGTPPRGGTGTPSKRRLK